MSESEFAGLLEAAKSGDLTALRAMADYFRERGYPSDPENEKDSDEEVARCLDVLAHEWEVAFVRARQVRVVLPQIVPPMPRRYSNGDLYRFFCDVGLPIEVYHGVGRRAAPNTTYLRIPTDGQEEATTKATLLALLKAIYPRKVFDVVFGNPHESEASWSAISEFNFFSDGALTAPQPTHPIEA